MGATSRTLTAKFDGDVTGLAGAVKKGDRIIHRFGADSAKRFGDGFGGGFQRWLRGDGTKMFGSAGQFGGSVFGSGLLGALKTPVLGPILVGVLAATVATVMPAVGAVAAGALVTGFGGGLAALGIVFAAKSEAVGRVWSTTMSGLGADMRLLSKPFEATLIHIAGFFRRTVDAFNPHLASAFGKMAGPIERFVDKAARALEGLIPAVDPMVDAFNAVLDTLGPAMQKAIDNMAGGLIRLADSVSKNPKALADLVEGAGTLVTAALDLITTLNDLNGAFSDLTGGFSLVDGVMAAATGSVGALNTVFGGMKSMVGGSTVTLGEYGNKVAVVTGNAKHAGPAVQSLADKIKAQSDAIEILIGSMNRLSGLALSLSNAQIGLAAAAAAATASIKDNGRTLNINTEKGRANRTALNNLAEAANRQTEAMLRSGKSHGSAANAAEASRRRFVTFATQMGLSKTQAEKLAASLIAIPNVTRTAKLQAHKQDLDAKLAAARKSLADPKLTATKRAKIEANIKQLQAQIAAAKAALASIRDRTVWIKYASINTGGGGPGRLPVEPRAGGGPVLPGRSYLLHGQEVLTMGASGGFVTPNRNLTEIPGGDTHVYVTIDGQQLEGRIDRVVRDRDRSTKRAILAGAWRGAPT
jgi:hypothetical protein